MIRPWTLILIAGVILILLYEIRANVGYEYPTLTIMLRQLASDYPMLGVLIGILVGHLFWFNGGVP